MYSARGYTSEARREVTLQQTSAFRPLVRQSSILCPVAGGARKDDIAHIIARRGFNTRHRNHVIDMKDISIRLRWIAFKFSMSAGSIVAAIPLALQLLPNLVTSKGPRKLLLTDAAFQVFHPIIRAMRNVVGVKPPLGTFWISSIRLTTTFKALLAIMRICSITLTPSGIAFLAIPLPLRSLFLRIVLTPLAPAFTILVFMCRVIFLHICTTTRLTTWLLAAIEVLAKKLGCSGQDSTTFRTTLISIWYDESLDSSRFRIRVPSLPYKVPTLFTYTTQSITSSFHPRKVIVSSRLPLFALRALLLRGILGYSITHGMAPFACPYRQAPTCYSTGGASSFCRVIVS